jgi:phosphoglucosamine mutase
LFGAGDRPGVFGTSGVRGPVGETVTADLALAVGRAVGAETDRVVVGRDARESGRFLADAVAAGLAECGADVIDCGRVATPTLARAAGPRDADAGVMVTASHNPAPDNGLKLWTAAGRAFGAERRRRVAERVEREGFEPAAWDATGGRERWRGASAHHRRALVDAVAGWTDATEAGDGDARDAAPLEGLSVVVDAGNGVGGPTAAALVDLGASVETLNADPDGRFPGRPSEPTAENCGALRSRVADAADLGIAHDGDADRTAAVDATGRFVPGDELLALFGRASASAGETVVAPVNTSLAAADALADAGIALERTPVGDAHVAERAVETGAAFGGEPSGAWIWPAESPCPDGPLAAVRLAALVASEGPLADLLPEAGTTLHRASVPVERRAEAVAAVAERAGARAAADGWTVERTDGVRVETDRGWLLVRASGTEPVVRLTAEGRRVADADDLLATARDLLATARAGLDGDGDCAGGAGGRTGD